MRCAGSERNLITSEVGVKSVLTYLHSELDTFQ